MPKILYINSELVDLIQILHFPVIIMVYRLLTAFAESLRCAKYAIPTVWNWFQIGVTNSWPRIKKLLLILNMSQLLSHIKLKLPPLTHLPQ